MCGRVAQVFDQKSLELYYGLDYMVEPETRYNLAPSQYALVVRINPQDGKRELTRLQWGLMPPWARQERGVPKLINARAETVAIKPSFREALRQRRAIIPVSGYYEWQKEGARKQPFFIYGEDKHPLSLAGIWERWEKGGEARETFAIITVAAQGRMAELHDRMPQVLPRRAVGNWLAGGIGPAELQELLRPFSEVELAAYPVSSLVNNPANDSPLCMQAINLLTNL